MDVKDDLTTAPRPKTATVEFVSTLQVFHTAPRPVETPHPKRHAFFRSALGLILAQEISAITVYSLMVLHLFLGKGYMDVKRSRRRRQRDRTKTEEGEK